MQQIKIMNKASTTRLGLVGLLAACLLMLSPGLFAEYGTTGTNWDDLNQAQQQLLQQFKDDWNSMPEQRRNKLATGAERWSNMTPTQRKRAQQSLKRWKKLSPEQQQKIRQRVHAFRALPLETRQALRAKYQWYRELPPEKQRALRERWRNLSAQEKAQVRERLSHPKPAQTEQAQTEQLRQHDNGADGFVP